MTQIGILSDTHGKWDDRYIKYFTGCHEVWHAGDIGDYSIIERLQEVASVVRAVSGNTDFGMVKRKCREIEVFKVEGVNVLLTHIGGYPGRWATGIKTLLKKHNINLMVDGHSHILKVMYDTDNDLLHINPGAAGEQGWHKVRTLIRVKIDGTDIKDCEIIELASHL